MFFNPLASDNTVVYGVRFRDDKHITIFMQDKGNISSKFPCNSEENASKLLEIIEEMSSLLEGDHEQMTVLNKLFN